MILLDVVMPGRSGIDAIPDLKESPESKVLVLSMQDDAAYVREALGAGASGYVLKEAADAEVVAAVREVANGRPYVHPRSGPVSSPRRPTSARARRRIRSRSESTRSCDCSPSDTRTRRSRASSTRCTVETHRSHIMQKLRITTRAELVRYALEHGMLEEGD